MVLESTSASRALESLSLEVLAGASMNLAA